MSDILTVGELIARHRLAINQKSVNPGIPGTIHYVNPKDLLIDHSYQRDLNTTHASNIGQNFDFSQMKIPSGFKSSEGILIVDGQHTCTGAALAGIDKIAVYVIENTDKNIGNRAFQSKQFLAINCNNKTVTRYDILRNQVIQEDPDAIAIMKACADYNVVPCHKSNNRPGHMSHINNLSKAWKQIGEKSVRRTFGFIRANWPDEPIHGAAFIGICRFFQRTEFDKRNPVKIDDSILLNALTNNGTVSKFQDLDDEIFEPNFKHVSTTSKTQADIWRNLVIILLYNKLAPPEKKISKGAR